LTKEKIDLFAFHQPNKLILDHLAMKMDIPPEKIMPGLQNTGNTASASIPLLLSVKKGESMDFSGMKKVFACGFGMGLSVSAAIVDLSETCIIGCPC
jgi:3-oxoacyl-[acyl-carrier-protein] synthase-3